jgi:hypothetical protein
MEFAGSHPDLHWSSTEKSIGSCGFGVTMASQCDSIVRFFSSSWWTRIWTVQECVLAQRMEYMYDQYRIDADILRRFHDYCSHHGSQCCAVLDSIGSTSSSPSVFVEQRLASGDDGVRGFNTAFRVVSMNRRFAVTDKGYIGWVPADARKGDIVALFPGGNVPYVLRPVSQPNSAQSSMSSDTRNRRYEFLGDAYIHGIMHGEAWNEADLEDVTLV